MLDNTKALSGKPSMAAVDVQCAELGEVLGLSRPVSLDVLHAATNDATYANRLLAARRNRAALEFLLARPPKTGPAARQPLSNAELVRKASLALMRWGKTGFGVARQEQLENRRNACLACPELSDPPESALYKLTAGAENKKICSACGCNIWAKTRMLSEACPLAHQDMPGMNRWGEPHVAAVHEATNVLEDA